MATGSTASRNRAMQRELVALSKGPAKKQIQMKLSGSLGALAVGSLGAGPSSAIRTGRLSQSFGRTHAHRIRPLAFGSLDAMPSAAPCASASAPAALGINTSAID
jgi:hypothetical protein